MQLALVIVAVILLALAAFNIPRPGTSPAPGWWINLGWLGMAFFAASTIVGRLG